MDSVRENLVKNMINSKKLPKEVLIDKFNIKIVVKKLRWDPSTFPRCNWLEPMVHGMYDFVFTAWEKYCSGEKKYLSYVKKQTENVDIFAHDLILVPVPKKHHLCMAIINMKKKTIDYHDSRAQPNDNALNKLAEFLKFESLNKKKVQFDMSDWKMNNVQNIPLQEVDGDCAVFSCMFAEFVTRKLPIEFTQNDIPYFRKKMAYEIIKGKMLS